MNNQRATGMASSAAAGDAVSVPQVVASYAAYVRTRAQAEPDTSVSGDRAQVSVTRNGRTLVLAFGRRKREWILDSAEVRRGEHAAKFGRHELAKAMAALLSM